MNTQIQDDFKSDSDSALEIYYRPGPIVETEYEENTSTLVNKQSLSSTINLFGPFPPYSSILGLCEDGLPLLLDLANPKSGSILLAKNSNDNIEILKTMLTSLSWITPSEKVGFCIISREPDKYLELYQFPHCQALAAPYERRAGELIVNLSQMTEQRRYGRQSGTGFILVIDEIDTCIEKYFDFDINLHLQWIISNGPGSKIWPIATIKSKTYYEIRQVSRLNFTTIIREIKNSQDNFTFRNDTSYPITLDEYPQNKYEVMVGNKSRRFSSLLV